MFEPPFFGRIDFVIVFFLGGECAIKKYGKFFGFLCKIIYCQKMNLGEKEFLENVAQAGLINHTVMNMHIDENVSKSTFGLD